MLSLLSRLEDNSAIAAELLSHSTLQSKLLSRTTAREGAAWAPQNPSLSSSKVSFVYLKNKPFQQTILTGPMYATISSVEVSPVRHLLTVITVLGTATIRRRCLQPLLSC
jgi:hypothetical protein